MFLMKIVLAVVLNSSKAKNGENQFRFVKVV